jgi:hypothetical protein
MAHLLALASMIAFVCDPHSGIRLTRVACAKRHASALAAYGPSSVRTGKVWSESCATCELGKAHVRGEAPVAWPSGARVIEVQLIPVGALLRSEPARRRGRRTAIAAVG